MSVGVRAQGLAVARGCVRAAAQRELPEGARARRELLVVGSWAGGPYILGGVPWASAQPPRLQASVPELAASREQSVSSGLQL